MYDVFTGDGSAEKLEFQLLKFVEKWKKSTNVLLVASV